MSGRAHMSKTAGLMPSDGLVSCYLHRNEYRNHPTRSDHPSIICEECLAWIMMMKSPNFLNYRAFFAPLNEQKKYGREYREDPVNGQNNTGI